jgi:hypothetical protein
VWPYRYQRFEALARALALLHGRHFRRNVDLVYVSFHAPLFHLYRYLDVKILLHVSYRLGGLGDTPDLAPLLDLLKELHDSGRLCLAASNEYDRRYVQYFTGLDCPVVSVDCSYFRDVRYRPQPALPPLVGPLRLSEGGRRALAAIRAGTGRALPTMREAHPKEVAHIHERICRHPCVVMLPYSVHSIAITECLRSDIPLFFPSHALLSRWHADHYLIGERKPAIERGRSLPPFAPPGAASMPQPDDDLDQAAASWWLRHCDWYQWPVVLFDSIEELDELLETTDLSGVSERAREFNCRQKAENVLLWEALLDRLLST